MFANSNNPVNVQTIPCGSLVNYAKFRLTSMKVVMSMFSNLFLISTDVETAFVTEAGLEEFDDFIHPTNTKLNEPPLESGMSPSLLPIRD